MPKYDIDNVDPNDSQSINISVYKPDGILSFWNWFTRRNKTDGQRKNIQFKINKEDLDKIKQSGFDFQKLQNLDLSNKNKAARLGNVFAIPKTDLEPFLLKSLHPAMRSKAYVKRLISKSTISIRSKESCANLKYVRTVRSVKSVVNSVHGSKTSFKISMRSNTNVHSNQPRGNVLLKSVPTTVLKSNTKKCLIPQKGETSRANRTTRTNTSQVLDSQQHAQANSNTIPTFLTTIQSMEEPFSDTENTKKKPNEAVIQKSVIKKINSQNDLSYTEQNRQKTAKCVASHKIYSKNIHAPRKNKKNRPKEIKKNSNTNTLIPNKTPLKSKSHKSGFAFNYFSDSSNECKNPNEQGYSDFNPGLFFSNRGFTLPNNMSKVEFSPENASDVGCDLIKSVVKALTETKGSTNLMKMDNFSTKNNSQYPNIGTTKVGVLHLGSGKCISKSTFDWKHPRVSTSSEPHIPETAKSNQDSIKVKKNISTTLGNQGVSNESCERNCIFNQIFNPKLQKKLVLELLRNNNTTSQPLPVQDETQTIGGTSQNRHSEKPEETDVEDTECTPNNNVDNPEIASYKACESKQNSAHSSKVTKSQTDTNTPRSGQEDCQLLANHNGFSEINSLLTDVVQCSDKLLNTEQGHQNPRTCEDNGFEITKDRGTLCSVSIERNAGSAVFNSSDKQFKRTTISCCDAKKEPKVSITIMVEDSMKGEVEMTSKVLKNSTALKDEYVARCWKEEHSPPLSSLGARGDHLSTVQSNSCKTESLYSLETVSSMSCVRDDKVKVSVPKATVENSPYSRTNKNFCVEVEDNGKQTFPGEGLNLGSPGTYLNYEKRKVLDEKVLGCNKNRLLIGTVNEKELVLPTRNCSSISNGLASFDHVIETSFIRKETSYSKTKFNICKENKYSSKTSTEPLESTNRCIFSDESLTAKNEFDVSTKYSSQQCVMYCRNNSLAQFNRPQFPLYEEKSSENIKFEQPFIVVQTPNNNKDNNEVDRNKKGKKLWQNGFGLNVREDAIEEESEDESVVENIVLNGQQIDEKNHIEIKTSYGSLGNNHEQSMYNFTNTSSDRNILDNINMHKSPTQQAQPGNILISNANGVATESNLKDPSTQSLCDFGLSDSERKYTSLTTNEPSNSISRTGHSSTMVQTDWSLVGMTVDHLNKTESTACQRRTVASQTDVMMDQIALMNKDLEGMHNSCMSCMKNCQFSELVACNVSVSHQANNLQEAPKILLENRETTPFNDIQCINEMQLAGTVVTIDKERDLNVLEDTSSVLHIHKEVFDNNRLEEAQLPTLPSFNEKPPRKLEIVSQYCEIKSEENLTNVNEDFPHHCTISCLTTLSDETIMSNFSGPRNKITTIGIPDSYKAPHTRSIKRGVGKNRAPQKKLSPILEVSSGSSGKEKSQFCRVIGNHDVDDEESSQDELCTDTVTTLGETDEAVQDSMMNLSSDCPDRTDVNSEQLIEEITNLESVLETKKVIGNTNEVLIKTSMKNIPKQAMKPDFSAIDKCTNYVQHLCMIRCDDKNQESLFAKEKMSSCRSVLRSWKSPAPSVSAD